jgi:hypothetical protein
MSLTQNYRWTRWRNRRSMKIRKKRGIKDPPAFSVGGIAGLTSCFGSSRRLISPAGRAAPRLGTRSARRPRARSRTPNPPSALYRRCALSWKLGAALVGRILADLGLSVPRGRAFAHVGESDLGVVVAAGDSGSTALTSRADGEENPAQIITGAPFSGPPNRKIG